MMWLNRFEVLVFVASRVHVRFLALRCALCSAIQVLFRCRRSNGQYFRYYLNWFTVKMVANELQLDCVRYWWCDCDELITSSRTALCSCAASGAVRYLKFVASHQNRMGRRKPSVVVAIMFLSLTWTWEMIISLWWPPQFQLIKTHQKSSNHYRRKYILIASKVQLIHFPLSVHSGMNLFRCFRWLGHSTRNK